MAPHDARCRLYYARVLLARSLLPISLANGPWRVERLSDDIARADFSAGA